MGKSRKSKKILQSFNTNRQQATVLQKPQIVPTAEKNKGEPRKKTSEKGVYIVWIFFAAILTWLLGCFFYDSLEKFASFINVAIAAVGLISALFTIFGGKIDVAEPQKRFILAISTGVITGASLSFLVCTSLGFRLKLISVNSPSNRPETAEALDDEVVGTDILEVYTETPIDELPEEKPLPIQESVAPETPSQDGLEADFVGSETDPDPNTPITVTVSPEGNNLISFNVLNDFYKMIGIPNENGLPPVAAENKEFLESVLMDKIKSLLNTNSLPDGSRINQNQKFTSETEEANRIQQDIKDNGQSLAKQRDLIDHREKAYAVYPARSLDSLLSYDYSELARLYKVEEKWEDAYRCYMKSIEHEICYIRSCAVANDYFYVRLYNIAVRCHGIGDMDGLNTETKQQAYYLAMCLFEATSKNEFSVGFQDYQAKCYYYAGMTNHKLLNLYPNQYNSETLPYFLHSYMFYEKSLQYPGDKKYKYTYLAQLCEWALAYIERQGVANGMEAQEEYERLKTEYAELGW